MNRRTSKVLMVLAISLGIPLLIVAITYSQTPVASSKVGPFSGPGALPLYPWNTGNVVTLQQASQATSFKVATPSSLPADTQLSQVRLVTNGGSWLMLGYQNPNLTPLNNNNQNLSIVITEQAQSPDPFTVLTVPPGNLLPLTTTIKYPNGTTVVSTASQTISTPTNVNVQTVDGNIVGGGQFDGYSVVAWWSGGVTYQVYGTLPHSQIVSIAQSMGL